jgi:hypothetical protein
MEEGWGPLMESPTQRRSPCTESRMGPVHHHPRCPERTKRPAGDHSRRPRMWLLSIFRSKPSARSARCGHRRFH